MGNSSSNFITARRALVIGAFAAAAAFGSGSPAVAGDFFTSHHRIVKPRLLINRAENIRLRIQQLVEGRLRADEAARGVGQFASLGTVVSPVADDGPERPSWGIWVDGTYTHIEGDEPGAEFDGPQWSIGTGLDATLNNSVVVGVSVTYDGSNIENNFGGAGFAPGRLKTEGIGVGPYIGIQLTDNLIFDASFTYSWADNDISDQVSVGDFTSQSWNVAANLTGYVPLSDNLMLSPTVGLTYSYNRDEDYRDSLGFFFPAQTIYTGVLNFGASLSYTHAIDDVRSITPSISASGNWEFDLFGNPPLDSGLVASNVNDPGIHASITGGLEVVLSEMISVSLTGGVSGLGRKDYIEFTGGGQVAVVF